MPVTAPWCERLSDKSGWSAEHGGHTFECQGPDDNIPTGELTLGRPIMVLVPGIDMKTMISEWPGLSHGCVRSFSNSKSPSLSGNTGPGGQSPRSNSICPWSSICRTTSLANEIVSSDPTPGHVVWRSQTISCKNLQSSSFRNSKMSLASASGDGSSDRMT